MNNNKLKKNIWAVIFTIVCIITICGLVYIHHEDNSGYQTVHHVKHTRVTPKVHYEQSSSPHIFGFIRLRYYLSRPKLAQKWSKDDLRAIKHYGAIDNLAAWQYKYLMYVMPWYNLPQQSKYRVKFSKGLIQQINNDYRTKIKSAKKSSSVNVKVANQIRWDIFIDINKIRVRKHLKPYRFDKNLQRVANIRVYQTNQAYLSEPNKFEKEKLQGHDANSDKWIHGIDKKQTNIDDAKNHKIPVSVVPNGKTHDGMLDENAGPIYIGKGFIEDYHYKSIENNNSIKAIAQNSVNNMVYHDNFAHNGHRRAILAKHHSSIGIGVYFNKSTKHQQKGAVVEEFD